MGALKAARRSWRRHDGLTPKDAAMADRVKRARAPKHDETSAIDLAREFNVDFGDVLELVDERRAIRLYDGNHSWEDAERLGLQDVRDILTARNQRR